jgi:hypothetical protein
VDGFRSALIEKKDRTTERSPLGFMLLSLHEAIDRPDPRLTGAAATALLLWLIARDDVGMTADMIRALSAAGLIFVVVAGGSLLKGRKKNPARACL